jgi:hypothetical protein
MSEPYDFSAETRRGLAYLREQLAAVEGPGPDIDQLETLAQVDSYLREKSQRHAAELAALRAELAVARHREAARDRRQRALYLWLSEVACLLHGVLRGGVTVQSEDLTRLLNAGHAAAREMER